MNNNLVQRLRDHAKLHRQGNDVWTVGICTAAADRIEALEEALHDAATLLPPERRRLLQPSTREALDA